MPRVARQAWGLEPSSPSALSLEDLTSIPSSWGRTLVGVPGAPGAWGDAGDAASTEPPSPRCYTEATAVQKLRKPKKAKKAKKAINNAKTGVSNICLYVYVYIYIHPRRGTETACCSPFKSFGFALRHLRKRGRDAHYRQIPAQKSPLLQL